MHDGTECRRSIRTAILGLAFTASGLTAQVKPQAVPKAPGEPTRHGFYIGFAMGYGSASQQCAGCPDEPTLDGVTFLTSVGWGLGDHLVLAVEPYVWINGGGAFTRTQQNEIQRGEFSLVGQVYPSASRGTFLRGGAGYGAYWTTINTIERRAEGYAFQVGFGHDLQASRKLIVRLSLTYHDGQLGAVREVVLGGPGRIWSLDSRQQILAADIGLFLHPPMQ